jgi:sulfopyruvate decarboxylase subunit beta
MMIQSSGLGNSLNALMSLHKGYNLPLPIIASWRGKDDHFKGTQVHFGKHMPELFKMLKIPCDVIESPDQVGKIAEAIWSSYEKNTPHIVLVPPEIWEVNEDKAPAPSFSSRRRNVELIYRGKMLDPQLTLPEALRVVSGFVDDEILVASLGDICPELYHAKDRDLNFYVIAALGQASSVGLGMAINTSKQVYVIDGDGSMLMNPNILCEIASLKPSNLTLIVLDNGTYSTTGNQKTPAYDLIDLELLARSLGFSSTRKALTEEEITGALKDFEEGPHLLHVVIKPGISECGKTPLNPQKIKERFMNTLLQTK